MAGGSGGELPHRRLPGKVAHQQLRPGLGCTAGYLLHLVLRCLLLLLQPLGRLQELSLITPLGHRATAADGRLLKNRTAGVLRLQQAPGSRASTRYPRLRPTTGCYAQP